MSRPKNEKTPDHRPVTLVSINQIKPHRHNARTHAKKQIRQIADSIQAFGFASPVLIDEDGLLLAGHGRLEAAKLLRLQKIPAIVIEGLSEGRKRALLLADNRIAQNAGWDRERLAGELLSLPEVLLADGLDLTVTGFEPAEVDALLADFENNSSDPADDIDSRLLSGPVVSCAGDLWQLGNHRLLCGDARDPGDLGRLMGRERANMAFLDPPYNVRVRDIGGRGRVKHREFAMASGEMSTRAFKSFLTDTLACAGNVSVEGAVHFVCMDWRHVGELIVAGTTVYNTMLNLIVWVKSNAGQGSFYRSQHELIGVFRVGDSPHLNTIELGRHGRSRSNVWRYAGANSFRAGRLEDLRAHPTVKPVALVADAIKDCTQRNQIVIDTFCGSGTTLLAAERVGRKARAIDLDPRYVDVAIRRWQAFTGRDAIHADSGGTFEEMSRGRVECVPTPRRART
ncbi:MAG TPA: DNA methyltransferase [Pseudolabrys sp.]|jgi:DNA modification methylase|nr:DNA methyltransferase [Pseudolabrys sp.]